jgi:diguanylate cyclase (GGDEF)-like protein
VYEFQYPRAPLTFRNSAQNFKENRDFTIKNVDGWMRNIRRHYDLVLNVDYRTIDQKWADELFDTLGAGFNHNAMKRRINEYVQWVKDNQIIVEGWLEHRDRELDQELGEIARQGGKNELSARMERPYSVLMGDIDRLKTNHDTYGHEAGNRAVKLVADALRRLTRSTGLVGRLGGDEMIVLLANADRTVAEDVAQRIRNVVFSTTLEVDVRIVRVKVAVGVGTYPADGAALQQMITAADRAMYKDKEPREPKGKLVIHRR